LNLLLRDDVLPTLRLNVTEAAKQLDVSRALNGYTAIAPEMALRIEAWLGVERYGHAKAMADRIKRL
jgi:plasmid maintenance system antidote protein VapI